MKCMCVEITSKELDWDTSRRRVPHLIRTCDRYAWACRKSEIPTCSIPVLGWDRVVSAIHK